ncbi:LCP family protein [Pseudonocardia sp.]|uniref:LCP family protein n=1 Tax=Pseudonocardia sp. TaxID=60912 RepID=UPI003D0D7A09
MEDTSVPRAGGRPPGRRPAPPRGPARPGPDPQNGVPGPVPGPQAGGPGPQAGGPGPVPGPQAGGPGQPPTPGGQQAPPGAQPTPSPAGPSAPALSDTALSDTATRPLRGILPPAGELPTRRLPRTVDDPDDRPTTLIGPSGPAPGAAWDDAHDGAGARHDGAEAAQDPIAPWTGAIPATSPDEAGDRAAKPGAPPTDPPAASPQLRRVAWPEKRDPRTLKRALLAAAASTVAPGAGQILLRRRHLGTVLLGGFVVVVAVVAALAATTDRAALLEKLLSTRVLIGAAIVCLAAAATWIGVIVHAYLIGRPRRMRAGKQVLGAATVAVLCLAVATPLGLAAHVANSQRSLLDALFPSGGADAAAAIGKPRLTILLVGSDAGPDRTGTRTDTMMVASIDTRTGRTTLFGLPRNIGFARFPPGSPMAERFPNGFHDRSQPLSGDYLLNAVYAYGHAFPQVAPPGPTADPGLNLLQSSISYMLGLPIDYQIVVDMAGFAALIDALGGLTVDVGPERITIGGIGPHGQKVRPQGFIEPGVQQLTGEQALAFARSRTNSSDYVRMGRQRCLIQYVLEQKTPTDLLTNFQAVARATTASVSTDVPREVLPALVALAGGDGFTLESIAFDPNLPDPNTPDGRFNTYNPDVPYMRQVVREAISRPASAPAGSAAAPPAAPSVEPDDGATAASTRGSRAGSGQTGAPVSPPVPQALAESCTPSAVAAAAASDAGPAPDAVEAPRPQVTKPPRSSSSQATSSRGSSSGSSRNSASAEGSGSSTSGSDAASDGPSSTRSRSSGGTSDSSDDSGDGSTSDGT